MSLPFKSLLVLALLALSSCGFQPMYGDHSALAASSPLQGNMTIDPLKDRSGQILKAALEDLINPEGIKTAAPEYHLQLSLSQNIIPTVITANGTIERYDARFDSTFKLYHNGDNKLLFSGSLHRNGSFNVAPNENFSTYEAQQDAAERVLKEMAEDYVLRLTGYFSKEQ